MENIIDIIVCPNCGAKASDKNICEYCGSVLANTINSKATIGDFSQKADIKLEQTIIEMYKTGAKLGAIKEYATRTNCDLASAKKHVEQLCNKHNIRQGNGCLSAAGIILLIISLSSMLFI